MNIDKINEKMDFYRKFKEYEMKIIKMAGYLGDYYIDRAIETDDFSTISSFLISYFSGPAGSPFDVGYLISKYKEYGLNEKIEDIDFNIEEWYKVQYNIEHTKYEPSEWSITRDMTEEEYIEYMIEKRKNEIENDNS